MRCDFATFYTILAIRKGWKVPEFHIRICDWMERKGRIAVLRVFRGGAKSTIAAAYEAWRLYEDQSIRFLVQAADDATARKMSRDCKAVLNMHPLTKGLLHAGAGGDTFWIKGNSDARNASMNAQGVLSNVVSSRADEVVFDDVEVPRNIGTEDARRQLRERIAEATFILTPHGSKLYIGTPHTHDSIYDEIAAEGASTLTIPLFAHNTRAESDTPRKSVACDWADRLLGDEIYVFVGQTLIDEDEYEITPEGIEFHKPQSGLVDIYGECAWPERFTRDDIALRRKESRGLNRWDSQYMLRAKPIHEMRLNPAHMIQYADPVRFRMANGELVADIGPHRVVGVRAYWDVALGNAKGDTSALSVLFQDDHGRQFWHAAAELTGDLDEQCQAAKAIAVPLKLPLIHVESNGVGGFVSAALKKALAGTGCAVKPIPAKGNKDDRILGAIEPPLSARMLYVHESINPAALKQMRDYIPGADQHDDFLDSLSGAILQAPVRLKATPEQRVTTGNTWLPSHGSYEAQLHF